MHIQQRRRAWRPSRSLFDGKEDLTAQGDLRIQSSSRRSFLCFAPRDAINRAWPAPDLVGVRLESAPTKFLVGPTPTLTAPVAVLVESGCGPEGEMASRAVAEVAAGPPGAATTGTGYDVAHGLDGVSAADVPQPGQVDSFTRHAAVAFSSAPMSARMVSMKALMCSLPPTRSNSFHAASAWRSLTQAW